MSIINVIEQASYVSLGSAPATQQEVQQQTGNSIFDDLDNWENAHADASLFSNSYEDYLNSDKAKTIGLNFDFMQGSDVKDEKAYNAQTLKLAQGEVDGKDTNKDGSLSFEEYYFNSSVKDEIETYKQFINSGKADKDSVIDMFSENLCMANKVFNIIDSLMGNGNGALDETELQQYYTHLDEYSSNSEDRTKDGKIGLRETTDYPEFLASQVKTSDDTYQSIRKYVASIFS